MPLIWTTTGEQADNGIKVCVHGASGAGKTKLIETAPSPVVGSAEGGTLSIAQAKIPMCNIATLSDLMEFYNWCAGFAYAAGFRTVCLDSITEIAERILGVEKLATKDPRKAYGEMMEKIAYQLRQFRDLPKLHVYFSCKSGLLEQPDASMMHFPIMPGKATAQAMPYYFDEFLYLGVGSYDQPVPGQALPMRVTYRYLQTQRTLTIEAKDRSGALDEKEPPHLGQLFAKIAAHVSKQPG